MYSTGSQMPDEKSLPIRNPGISFWSEKTSRVSPFCAVKRSPTSKSPLRASSIFSSSIFHLFFPLTVAKPSNYSINPTGLTSFGLSQASCPLIQNRLITSPAFHILTALDQYPVAQHFFQVLGYCSDLSIL